MSFGFSPTDVVNLVQVSARVYVAFKDANDNSEAQVTGLIREFSAFHHCLVELGKLMKQYGKPLPFPYLDFEQTLNKCEQTIEPYANNLVDRKMSVKKFFYTIKYIGKEKEIENLRTQINGHYQALQMCISFLQLQLHLEATKQTQRLLDLAPFRALSFDSQHYTTNALAGSSRAALPAPSDAEELYRDWINFSRFLKNEDERLALPANDLSRPLSLGDAPTMNPSRDDQTAAVLYHLRRELEDAILIEQNRAKRTAVEKRVNLAPSDAVRQEMRNLPQVPQRTYTLDTDYSGSFSGSVRRTETRESSMSGSTATICPPTSGSPAVSPARSPQISYSYFEPVDWKRGSPAPSPSETGHYRTPSSATDYSSVSTSPGSHMSMGGRDNSTNATTPEDPLHILHSRKSAGSLISIVLGPGALQWNKLCRKVRVERTTSQRVSSEECDLHWRYRDDAGISIRSVYRSGNSKEAKVWITQHFPATGPSIPLTTSYLDGDISIDFPRASFGRLEKRCTDVKYIVADTDSSTKLQTLLYTNNGKEQAELLYDRPIVTISSNLKKPECRGKNVRLWRKSETRIGLNGVETVDVLVLLFYTSAQSEDKSHWVEEPHYIFQWLDDSVYKRSSDKLQLIVSKEPGKWMREKTSQRRTSSQSSTTSDDVENPYALHRSDSVASSAVSVKSSTSVFGGGRPSGTGSLNRFGYGDLEIKFQNPTDQKDFLEVWKRYVKVLV